MRAHAFQRKPLRSRGLNEAWAGNILPFPRKSPDFFCPPSPIPLTCPVLSGPLSISFRPLLIFYTSILDIHRPMYIFISVSSISPLLFFKFLLCSFLCLLSPPPPPSNPPLFIYFSYILFARYYILLFLFINTLSHIHMCCSPILLFIRRNL